MRSIGHIGRLIPLILSILLIHDIIGDKFVMTIMLSTTRQHGVNDTNTILKIEFHPSERSLISTTKSAQVAKVNQPTPKKTRSATSLPHNGSIFGKRSVEYTFKQKGINLTKHIDKSAPNTKTLDQTMKSPEDQLSRYNDIITDIIEEFMARNKEGECKHDQHTWPI